MKKIIGNSTTKSYVLPFEGAYVYEFTPKIPKKYLLSMSKKKPLTSSSR